MGEQKGRYFHPRRLSDASTPQQHVNPPARFASSYMALGFSPFSRLKMCEQRPIRYIEAKTSCGLIPFKENHKLSRIRNCSFTHPIPPMGICRVCRVCRVWTNES
ncbi:hypothetical protein ACMFMF_011143 [Clarireedia jacksonii]